MMQFWPIMHLNKLFHPSVGADLSALIRINRSHEDWPEAGWSVGVIFMITRRGWERGPVPCCERNEQSSSCHAEPQRSISMTRRDRPFAATQHDSVRHLRLCVLEGFHGRPLEEHAARSSRLQQGTGPRSHPRRVIFMITHTGHSPSGLTSWLRLMRMKADKSAPTSASSFM
jgi:hypothetical protein